MVQGQRHRRLGLRRLLKTLTATFFLPFYALQVIAPVGLFLYYEAMRISNTRSISNKKLTKKARKAYILMLAEFLVIPAAV